MWIYWLLDVLGDFIVSIKINNYKSGYEVVSLALNESTKEDLQKEHVQLLFINNGRVVMYPENIELDMEEKSSRYLENQSNYDVYEIWSDGRMFLRYDNASIDNLFFVTGKCNSNCIMCPSADSSRKYGDVTNVEHLIEVAEHIPSDAKHLTVTGGEPFLSGEEIFKFILFLREKFIETEFLFLTNGRIFALEKYANLLKETVPYNSIFAIPIHGSTNVLHDHITQVSGSFKQTMIGIKRLLRMGIKIEIRIVVSKLNSMDIDNIANLIINEIPQISSVSVIALEMTGSAYKNRDQVWLTYKESFEAASKAIKRLVKHGINVKLYNFPLCTVRSSYWAMCEKSISPHKVRYAECCEECKYKSSCGGVFAGTINIEKDELRAIK